MAGRRQAFGVSFLMMVFVADSFEWWVRWIPVVEWKVREVREGQKMHSRWPHVISSSSSPSGPWVWAQAWWSDSFVSDDQTEAPTIVSAGIMIVKSRRVVGREHLVKTGR
jgi:hypothetical protein